MSAERPAQFDLVADLRDLVKEGRDLAIVESLDRQFDCLVCSGAEAME